MPERRTQQGPRGLYTLTGGAYIALMLALVALVLLAFAPVTLASSKAGSPIIWFKPTPADRVEFSLDGKRVLAWTHRELSVMDVDGSSLLALRFKGWLSSTCIGPDGRLVAACLSERERAVRVAAYSVDEGREVWSVVREGFLIGRACFTPDGHSLVALYVEKSLNGSRALIECLDASSGRALWRFVAEAQGEVGLEPHISAFGEFVAASIGSRLLCFNHCDGKLIWEATLPSWVRGLKGALHGEVLVAAEWSGLHAFNASTGDELWCRDLEVPAFSLDVSGDGGLVVVGGWRGALAFNRHGELVWRYYHGLHSVTPVAASGEGYAIIAINNLTEVRAVFLDPEGMVLWEAELPRLSVCVDVAVTLDGEFAALGSEYEGLYLVKGRGYVEAPHPPLTKPPIVVEVVEEPPLRWRARLVDEARALRMLEDGSLVVATEGWLHLISNNGSVLWSKMMSLLYVDARGGLIAVAKPGLVELYDVSGVRRWSRAVEGSAESLALADSSLAVVERVAEGSYALRFYDLEDGALLAEHQLEAVEKGVVRRVEEGFIVVARPRPALRSSPSGRLVAVALGERLGLFSCRGASIWSIPLEDEVLSLDLTDEDVAVGLGNGTLILLSAQDGAIKWAVDLEAPVLKVDVSERGSCVAATKDGVAYCVSGGGVSWKLGDLGRMKGSELYYDVAVSGDGEKAALAGSHLTIVSSSGEVLFKATLRRGKHPLEEWLAASSDLTHVAVLPTMDTVQYYVVKLAEPSRGAVAFMPWHLAVSIAAAAIVTAALVTILRRRVGGLAG